MEPWPATHAEWLHRLMPVQRAWHTGKNFARRNKTEVKATEPELEPGSLMEINIFFSSLPAESWSN